MSDHETRWPSAWPGSNRTVAGVSSFTSAASLTFGSIEEHNCIVAAASLARVGKREDEEQREEEPEQNLGQNKPILPTTGTSYIYSTKSQHKFFPFSFNHTISHKPPQSDDHIPLQGIKRSSGAGTTHGLFIRQRVSDTFFTAVDYDAFREEVITAAAITWTRAGQLLQNVTVENRDAGWDYNILLENPAGAK
ncbi:hypothetical protein PG984_002691 [Apiospora sp. TS-2023a]